MRILGFFTKLARRSLAEAVALPATPSVHPTLLRADEPNRINHRLGITAAGRYPVCLVAPALASDPFIAFQLDAFASRCSRQAGADVLGSVEATIHRLTRAPRYLTRRLLVVAASHLPEDQPRLSRLGAAASEAGIKLDLVLVGQHCALGYLAALQADSLTVAHTAPEIGAAIRTAIPAAVEAVATGIVLESSAAMRAPFGGRSVAAIVANAMIRSLPRPAEKTAATDTTELQAA